MSALQAFPVGFVHIDPDDEVEAMAALIGRGRGFALNIGTLSLVCATAASEEERREAAAELRELHAIFVHAMAEAIRNGPKVADMTAMMPQRKVLQRFLDQIATLPERAMTIERPEAVAIALAARREVLPAIYEIIAHLQERRDAALAERIAALSGRGAMLDKVMGDIGRISRMIGIVSINASVEAARAGGTSGRTFQVIAAEIRLLAQQSSALLAELRAGLAESPVAVPALAAHDRRRGGAGAPARDAP